LLAVLGIVVAGLTLRATDARKNKTSTDAQAVPTVNVIQPLRDANGASLQLSGRLEAFTRAPIFAQVSGYLKSWGVDIGAPVKAGQVLAEIETPELDQQILQARADLQSAQANALVAGTTAKRWEALRGTDSVAQQDVDQRTADYTAKEAIVAAAKANADRLVATNAFARIVAPFDGVVTARDTDVSALVSAGSAQELFAVSDVKQLRVYVQVPQNYAPAIHDGTTAILTVPEYPVQQFSARVVAASDSVNSSFGTTLVQLLVNNADGKLLPGGFASLKFSLPAAPDSLRVPASGKDEAQATKADLASVRLSLQVELADGYVRLRGLDQQTELSNETVVAFAKALRLTQTLHNSGIVSGLDVSWAQTQLSSAKSLLSQNLAQRALLEHAIAVLVGASASEFSLPTQTAAIALPAIPTGLPSTLLQRRPDVAAAERRVAEANAKIGVARAAYFPDVTLSLQGGVQSAAYAGLVSALNLFWAVGPQLVQYVFDGGYRRAQLNAAKTATEEAGERYRSVVLSAFQQVEDNLALLSYLGTALGEQRDAANAAQYSVDLALRQYRQGVAGYLDVVQAQTTALDAQRSVFDIQTRQLSANVQLLDALGGGRSSDELAEAAAAPSLVAAATGRGAN